MHAQDFTETEIPASQLPEYAQAFLAAFKDQFERKGFRFYGFTSRTYKNSGIQYAAICIGDSYKIIAHGLTHQRKARGWFSFGKQEIRKNRMVQSLFDNGLRLITSDLPALNQTSSRGVRCGSVTLDCSVDEMLEIHRKCIDEVIQDGRCSSIRIENLAAYSDFPKKYKYLEPVY